MMNLKPQDEELFNKNLKTYEQEFGKENLVIVFPQAWSKNLDLKIFAPTKVEAWELNAVGIRVSNCSANFTLLIT